MAEYNVDEYKVEGDGAQYNFKISLVDNKINLQLSEISSNKRGKNFEGEFTLDELRQINRIFQLTTTIFEAQEEFKKAIERQKIALSENEAYVNIMFHMVLGTDNSPFVIALPRNESARIIKLEQETDLLKLERDNLLDKLFIIKTNTDEILRNTRELESENMTIEQTTKLAEEEMKRVQIPSFAPVMKQVNYDAAIGNNNKMNVSKIKSLSPKINPINSVNINNSASINNSINQNVPINPAVSGVSNVSINNMMKISGNSVDIPQSNIVTDPITDAGYIQPTKFPCGIIKNIIQDESLILFVVNKIEESLGKNTFNLLYKASTDGDRAADFHSRCDKANSSLVLIMDIKGNIFGGFTSRDWSGDCIQKVDEKAFVFSVNKGKIYEVLPGQAAIGCYPNFGPIFFGCQIRVYDDCFTKGGSTYLKGVSYNTTMDYELTNGDQKYTISEIEVYEII